MKTKLITTDEIDISVLAQPGVHIYDGIAGSAKTSTVVKTLQNAGVPYMHTTSTNKLRRDIEARFGGKAFTVAGGLFNTNDGHFYDTPKDITSGIVVIDEILQTAPAVFDWIDNNAERSSVIVCTDTRQMLAPNVGIACLRRYKESIEKYGAYLLNYSYRPVDEYTRDKYNLGYIANPDGTDLFQRLVLEIPHTKPEDVPYSVTNAYICHTNRSETNIYIQYNLKNRYDLPLIPKGGIASKKVDDITRYPIVSQEMAQRMGAKSKYFQVANVGSVVRFQGTEVMPDAKCYFYVPEHACVTNRECYTMLTRCKSFGSIVIVDCEDDYDLPDPVSFNGVPVLPKKWLIRDDMNGDTDNEEKIRALATANENSNDAYYIGILSHGICITKSESCVNKRNAVSISGLLKKQPELALTKPNLFLSKIEKTTDIGYMYSPTNFDSQEARAKSPDKYQYVLDLYAAYPHAWHNAKMIDGTTYRQTMDGEIKLYMVTTQECGDPGMIITGGLYDLYKDNEDFKAVPIGSANACDRTYIGDYLYVQAHDTVESKQGLRNIHYGFMQRQYLEPVKYGLYGGRPSAYILNKENVFLLPMVCIQSEIARIMAICKKRIYGDVYTGTTVVDAIYFDTQEDIKKIGDDIHKLIPNYDFRIAENTNAKKTCEKPVLYKTYSDLPTRKEKEKLRRQERRKKQKDGSK